MENSYRSSSSGTSIRVLPVGKIVLNTFVHSPAVGVAVETAVVGGTWPVVVAWACDGEKVTVPPATVDATPDVVFAAAVAPMDDDVGAEFVDARGVEFAMLLLAHCTPESERIQNEPKRLHIKHISCVFPKPELSKDILWPHGEPLRN